MAGTKFPMDKTLPKNMALLIKDRCERYADINLQAARGADGKFHYYTYAQVYESVIEFALGLTLGVHRGSNVALISDNRREWLVSDYALVCLGAPDVPRGCDSMGNEIRFIISYADCETGIFENSRQLKKITEKEDEVPLLKTAILFDPLTDEEKKEFKSSRLKSLFWAHMSVEVKSPKISKRSAHNLIFIIIKSPLVLTKVFAFSKRTPFSASIKTLVSTLIGSFEFFTFFTLFFFKVVSMESE